MYSTTTLVSLLAFVAPVVLAAPTTERDIASRDAAALEAFYSELLPSRTSDGTPIVDMRNSTGLVKRADCTSHHGVANGACVEYYSQSGNCGWDGLIRAYRPTCAGNCYVDVFNAIQVSGDGTYGTSCEAFSDNQCQTSVGKTGNKVLGNQCSGNLKGRSMKCYYRC